MGNIKCKSYGVSKTEREREIEMERERERERERLSEVVKDIKREKQRKK